MMLLGACGGAGSTSTEVDSPSASHVGDASPTAYALLPKQALGAALVDARDLPTGFSRNDTLQHGHASACGFKEPEAEVKVERDFIKGSGAAVQVVSVELSQYKSADEAKRAFDSIASNSQTCTSERWGGQRYTYAPMSAPKVADKSFGVRARTAGVTFLANYALVGPVVVHAVEGGMSKMKSDEVAGVLKGQVASYQNAART